MKTKLSLFWFRRDLRLEDNIGLCQALSSGFPVLPIFIFDKFILDALENKEDRRVDYIHQALSAINSGLKKHQSKLNTFYGEPLDIFQQLSEKYDIQAVFCNRDYEPQAIKRDTKIYNFFKTQNISFKAFKDQVIFDKKDVVKVDGTLYTVYTPYSKKWKEKLTEKEYRSFPIDFTNFFKQDFSEIHSLETIGFAKTDIRFEIPKLDATIIDDYDKFRDFPALQKTTQLGIALRFGTISIRKCVEFALNHNQTWLNELIWREFFMQILYHFPRVVRQSFKAKYDFIQWRNDEQEFGLWCQGKTGYPIVDAGMRQLNETGFMHNRVRMIVASFLCKHLLIDWRWGEAYFAQKLNDYDLSANNGNWQWAAGCGCDAAPYFRVFNPSIQTEKFDKNLEYIKKWLPEFGTHEYPKPMVEHSFARDRVLKIYGEAVK
ncbi:MAG: deoxyribodipyrimidine photo-lyase [Sphingobacteriales bacterium]|jgi:deoxyribodipyrimidine photo-lyase|nr:deoxyribodipyrimidine photo-lyase [Sphingobacteriales bacterium]MCC6722449.1 deoxyribodipyrimidine photo-lyase [Bacteroidia bacterium]MDA0199825.1 deoxyribodipyrimidine photo-lyase [Bacteroidota bacterium]MBK7526659.1 deoxyribodipyrimidine photo-lyase [Sphingobacteriales bacterium]MBK8678482.1 deoxyribodipyrimidine photo-lyase [Sphingobacteriales bacterium]